MDKLVAIESLPIDRNTKKQAALSVQISAIGSLISQIKNLATSATTLSKGVTASSIATMPSGISATAGTGAIPGRYSITVTTVAAAAKARSGAFTSANDTVAGGTISLMVKGVAKTIDITATSDLGSVVSQINQANVGVSAAVISDGTSFYVSLTNKETGKPIGSAANGGLSITADPTGLGLAVTQNANNATFKVDDLDIESQSNEVTSAIPGVTLSIKAQQLTASDLVIARDTATSEKNVQGFVDSFNVIMNVLKKSLRPDPKATNTGDTLDGTIVLDLQRRMHKLLSTPSVVTATYRTLADIGVKLQSDGTLLLNKATLSTAVNTDGSAVDAVFSTATTGLSAQTTAFQNAYTDVVSGHLIQRQTSITKTIADLKVSNEKLTRSVAAFKDNLQRRFGHMEKLMSNYNSIGSYISNSSILNPQRDR
ncbi:MAG: flagellar filament capping protein FliD [Deltaproteobacteria bacterium]|nr:flagellar filament capping protein FliD [Deltaproteobacteria bacterium]